MKECKMELQSSKVRDIDLIIIKSMVRDQQCFSCQKKQTFCSRIHTLLLFIIGPVLSGKGTRQGPPDDLDEGLTQDKLNQLHDLFEEMDEDGGGGLDIDEFKNAMRQTMGNISDKEIELIFMKVSTCN